MLLKVTDSNPWYANIVNFMVAGYVPPGENKKKLIFESRRHLWDPPYLYRVCKNGLLRRCVPTAEGVQIIEKCHTAAYAGHFGAFRTQAKIWQSGFFWRTMYEDTREFIRRCQLQGGITARNAMPLTYNLQVELFDVWGIDFMGPFLKSHDWMKGLFPKKKWRARVGMKTVGNGRENPLIVPAAVFFVRNGNGNGKIGRENEIGITGYRERNQSVGSMPITIGNR